MGQYFRHLRKIPWIPEFKWVDTVEEAADTINRPHEDYPDRTQVTVDALNQAEASIITRNLLSIHRVVFGEKTFGGQLRSVNVRVGYHYPPDPSTLFESMMQLQQIHQPFIEDIDSASRLNKILGAKVALTDWYTDFETIHPFQDGNGRVGGIIVALFSHKWFPEKGYLVPGQ